MNVDEYRALSPEEVKAIKAHGSRAAKKDLQAAQWADFQITEKARKAALPQDERDSETRWMLGLILVLLLTVGGCGMWIATHENPDYMLDVEVSHCDRNSDDFDADECRATAAASQVAANQQDFIEDYESGNPGYITNDGNWIPAD